MSTVQNNIAQGNKDLNEGDNLSFKFKLTITIITVLFCSLFFILRVFEDQSKNNNVTKGYTWNQDDVVSEYSFSILRDRAEYDKDLVRARQNSPSVFKYVDQSKANNRLINNLFQNTALASNDGSVLQADLKKNLTEFVSKIYKDGFISIDAQSIETNVVIIQRDQKRELINSITLNDNPLISEKFNSNFSSYLSNNLINIINDNLIEKLQPNLVFDEKSSQKERRIAESKVPRTQGFVKKGDIIIRNGDKISADHIRKINSYNNSSFLIDDNQNLFIQIIGSVGHVILILSIIFIYLLKLKKNAFDNEYKLLLLSFILIFISFLSWISHSLEINYPIEYLILLPAFSMLVAIVYDVRSSFYLTITMSFLVAGIRNNDHVLALAMVFAGFLSILSVRDIQNRSQIYKSILFIFIGLAAPILVFGLERIDSTMNIFQRLGFAAINAAASPLITFGLLFIIERTSSISTNLRIQEFDDLNHPLLQKMNEVAPGTYQHSLGVSALAERCAISIGANALFCRVAPYYHDIGKIEKAEYFAENQIGMDNKHDLISPFQSSKIIKNHVVNGAKMAKNAKLPESITDIIYMHHGTSVIKHFYAKAIEQDGFDNVDIQDFKYPGPIPDSKEAAIIMICDASEAISRLGNKSFDEHKNMITDIINNFAEQGQFDNCNITTKEISTIRNTIIKNLQGMVHKRVDYKKVETKKND